MLWRAFSEPQLGFGNFQWYLSDAVQRDVLVRTFTTALIVTVVCLVLGYPYRVRHGRVRAQGACRADNA